MSDEKSNGYSLEKKGGIMELWKTLKQSIFNVLFVILDKSEEDGQDMTMLGLSFEAGFDYAQMMLFPFNFTIIYVWNGGSTLNSVMTVLLSALQINNLLPGISYNSFLIMLYIMNFIILLVILDIIYVSYSFSKKKFKYTFPLVILGQVVPIFVTILFITIMEVLLNIINCGPSADDPSITVMNYFPTVVCLQGTHILHTIITLLFASVFVFISTIVAMTLFEPRMTTNKLVSRKNSNGEIIFIINKILCQFFFSLTPFVQTWPYIFIMFIPSAWLFYYYSFHPPHYRNQTSKFYRIMSSYYFWTNLNLFYSQIMLLLGLDFQGPLVVWFCGLPFIGLSIAYQTKSNIQSLFASNMKFKTGEEIQTHLLSVLQLINSRDKDQNANMLLVGYIEKHIETCIEEDCPIKFKKNKKEERISEMDENIQLLIIQIERMYKQGLKKFSSSSKLHISFAFFYLQRIKSNAKAYEEFTIAETCNPSFVEQFIIYRFRKIIRQKLEEKSEDESDLVEIIRLDNHVALCEEAMHFSSKLHKDFWSELQEDSPNLQKLNDVGGKITQAAEQIKINYVEVNKINSQLPEIAHNYAIYLMFISQNIKEGKKILQQSKKIYFEKVNQQKNELKSMKLGYHDNTFSKGECYASALIEGKIESMGKIIEVNDYFPQLTGYPKQEITEKNIEKILPQVMGFAHQRAMNDWAKDESKMYMNSPENVYFKTTHNGFLKLKSGFIAPIIYQVSYNIMEEKFTLKFKHEKFFNQNLEYKIYIITNLNGIVKDITSMGYAYFNMTMDNLSSTDTYLEELGITISDPKAFEEEGTIISLKPFKKNQSFKVKMNFQNIAPQQEIDVEETEGNSQENQFFMTIKKIWMICDPNEDYQGNSDRFQNEKEHLGNVICLQKLKKQIPNNRQVKFEALDKFSGDILNFYEIHSVGQISQEGEELIQKNQEEDQFMENSYASLMNFQLTKGQNMKRKIKGLMKTEAEKLKEKTFEKFGEKIKTYRYNKGEMKRVFTDFQDSEQDDHEFDKIDSITNDYEIERLKNPTYIKKIKRSISTNIRHKEVKYLKAGFSIFIILLFTLSILHYKEANSQLQNLRSYALNQIEWVNDSFFVNNLMYLSFDFTQQSLNTTIAEEYIVTFSPNINVSMLREDGTNEMMRLQDAIILLQSTVLNYITNSTSGDLVAQSYYNFFNNIYPILQNYKADLSIDFSKMTIYIILIAVSALTIIFFWVYHIMRIDKKCFDIILWFLDIPLPYVNYLVSNCNKFIKNYQTVKELTEKGVNYNQKHLFLEDYCHSKIEQSDQFNQDNKSRKILIARQKKKSFWSKFDFSFIKMFWLFFYSLVVGGSLMMLVLTEYNFASFLSTPFTLTNHQFIWSSTLPNIFSFEKLNLTNFPNFNAISLQVELQKDFSSFYTSSTIEDTMQVLYQYGADVSDVYHSGFEGDVCSQFQNGSHYEKCLNISLSILTTGLSGVFSYYSSITIKQLEQLELIQFYYVTPQMQMIFSTWDAYQNRRLDAAANSCSVILYVYLAVTLFGFFLMWNIYLKQLNVRMNQTIQMLNMIPIVMLPKSRKDVREFFSWIIQEANAHNNHEI